MRMWVGRAPTRWLAALAVGVLLLPGCRYRTNQTFVGHGPDFDRSWTAAHEALELKGYTVDTEDRATGRITTAKRHKGDWWWIMDVTVLPDGRVEFYCRGSQNVHSGDKIHRRLLNFTKQLKNAFDTSIARRG